jgi:hypothetical protein
LHRELRHGNGYPHRHARCRSRPLRSQRHISKPDTVFLAEFLEGTSRSSRCSRRHRSGRMSPDAGDKVIELRPFSRRCNEPTPSREHVIARAPPRPLEQPVMNQTRGCGCSFIESQNCGAVRFVWRHGPRKTAPHRGPVAIILLDTTMELTTPWVGFTGLLKT